MVLYAILGVLFVVAVILSLARPRLRPRMPAPSAEAAAGTAEAVPTRPLKRAA
jgi:hypothetical protein